MRPRTCSLRWPFGEVDDGVGDGAEPPRADSWRAQHFRIGVADPLSQYAKAGFVSHRHRRFTDPLHVNEARAEPLCCPETIGTYGRSGLTPAREAPSHPAPEIEMNLQGAVLFGLRHSSPALLVCGLARQRSLPSLLLPRPSVHRPAHHSSRGGRLTVAVTRRIPLVAPRSVSDSRPTSRGCRSVYARPDARPATR